ncbi:LysR substrate-binding domain-containing protein [Klebsiella quasivariicola]|uniref:LysR substrate-binding domain-containing protein n=1 Tax=Klebsiella quasivariicola TaxID=2026240 RepID=UPI00286B7BC5|nr:LysR substrate-binding domain-containing protein [Klebsiella quasivariicola]
MIICASPAYLRKYGVPKTLHDLSAHRCSVFRHAATGRLIPWTVKSGDNVQDHHVNPAMSTNDEMLELHAVLMGEVIAQVAGPTAAQYIRSGQLIPLLTDNIADIHSLFLYYGSRIAQPLRVRRFIDLTIERLGNMNNLNLSTEELNKAHIQGLPVY